MTTKEDIIKEKIYLEFQKQYFKNKKYGETKAVQLSSKERLEFCRQQKLYVEKEYQKVKYAQENDTFM